jgi:hypothetical protein
VLPTEAAFDQIGGLSHGQDEEKLPEVVAIVEPRELSAPGPTEEAVQGAEGDILFIGRPVRRAAKPGTGKRDDSVDVPLPDRLRRRSVALIQKIDPVRDRAFTGHGQLRQRGISKRRLTGFGAF